MEEVVRVESLTKAYGALLAVDHVSLSVKRGMAFGLLEANGAGKSTIIECILGTKRADSGNVSVLSLDPRKDRRRLFQQVGVQFQECDYQPEIKVSELCEETACLYKPPADWRGLCEQFGIGDKAGSPVKSLSGGERQVNFVVTGDIADVLVLKYLKPGTKVNNDAAPDALYKLLENAVGGFGRMGNVQHIKNSVQFLFTAHGKKLVHLANIALLRWIPPIHIEHQGFQQIQFGGVPEVVAPLAASVFDDNVAKQLGHQLLALNL